MSGISEIGYGSAIQDSAIHKGTRKRAKPKVNRRSHVLKLPSFEFSPARTQSAEADGARARHRTGFFERDYEHEHEKAGENMGWVSERLE
jgi:hypothetical protein